MAMEIGKKDDKFFILEQEDYEKLVILASRLHSGSDKERDAGHTLRYVLDKAHIFGGHELFVT